VLDDANSALASGNYDEAARGYESYLLVDPPGPKRDEALFHLGLTLALRPSPTGDWKRAVATFNQLVVEYPNSPFKPSASLILSLRAELERGIADARQREQRIKQLTTELDRLTKIDAERRKRP
jgi:outer membrane protein assembly factor BamD (BamD/ComL family)